MNRKIKKICRGCGAPDPFFYCQELKLCIYCEVQLQWGNGKLPMNDLMSRGRMTQDEDKKLTNYDYKNGYNCAINDVMSMINHLEKIDYKSHASIFSVLVELKQLVVGKAFTE